MSTVITPSPILVLAATGSETVPFLGAAAVLILGGLGAFATRKAPRRDDVA